MDIKQSWFELVLHSLQIGLKNKHITKQEYSQYLKELMELNQDTEEDIRKQVRVYTEWSEENERF